MKITKSISFFAVFLTLLFAFTVSAQITAVAHIQDVGDKSFSGEQIGIAGRRLEGFSLKLDPAIPGLSLTYYCRSKSGDSAWLSEGDFCGTRGQGKGLFGIGIKLIGPEAKNYNVVYETTATNRELPTVGQSWQCFNGPFCGYPDQRIIKTHSLKYELDTFKITIVKGPARPYVRDPNNVEMSGTAHFTNIGDRHSEGDIYLLDDRVRVMVLPDLSEYASIEGFSLNIPNIEGLGLQYMCHLQDSGDTAWLDAGQFCGTRGEKRRLEGFAIRLTGPEAKKYNVEYGADFATYRSKSEGGSILSQTSPLCANGGFVGTRGMGVRYLLFSIQITIKRTEESKPLTNCQIATVNN